MPSRVRHITFDARDPLELARFWGEVTGRAPDAESDHEEAYLPPSAAGELGLLFIQVPEGKTAKNRVHLDLQPDQPRDQEVERLLVLGATLVDDRRTPDGTGWAVLTDPEGNEFCVERSAAERAAAEPPPRGT